MNDDESEINWCKKNLWSEGSDVPTGGGHDIFQSSSRTHTLASSNFSLPELIRTLAMQLSSISVPLSVHSHWYINFVRTQDSKHKNKIEHLMYLGITMLSEGTQIISQNA